jgi:hypothetical protein
MGETSGEAKNRDRLVLGSILAAGLLVAAGAITDHAITEHRAAHHSYNNDEPQVQCNKLEIVGLDSENVTLLPAVRALGNVPLAHLYTLAEDNRNFISNDHSDELRTVLNPGITAIQVPLKNQQDLRVSIVVSQETPSGTSVPTGSQVVTCPAPPIVVTR